MARTHTTRSTQVRSRRPSRTNTPIQEEGSGQSPVDGSPKAWQCGEPYQYPLPAPEGDPWQTLLTPILEKDKAQCDAWKDEVQNLLIFAGLFSAVVTAFVIEIYKGLQQDPGDAMILLLSRIANNLENPLNSSSAPIPASLPPFSPTPSSVRVNIFLFVSLILSLATVLIGIVSLQWLREHQAYTGSFTPQNTFATVHMRTEALEKWRVPEIFSVLPLILQSALILFFVGIIDFLSNIDVRVTIPVASVIGLTLVFLLFTTMLPTFQGFILHHPDLKVTDEVPVPCPYKSPQSKAFRRLITSSRLIFSTTSLAFAATYWMVMHLCLLPGQIIDSPFCHSVWKSLADTIQWLSAYVVWPSQQSFFKIGQHIRALFKGDNDNPEPLGGFNYMVRHIYGFWSVRSSFEFDLVWLSIRDNYFQSTCSHDSWLYQNRMDRQEHGAIYDAMTGLCKELRKDDVNMNADFDSPVFTAYHCAIDTSSFNQLRGVEQIHAVRTRNAYLTTLLGYGQLTPLSLFPNIMQNPTLPLLWEENAFVVVSFAYAKLYDLDISSPRLSRHLAEISFRFLGYLYSQPQLTYMSKISEDSPTEVVFSANELYLMNIFDDQDQPFTTQWALTIDQYFKAFDTADNINANFKSSFHSHPFIRGYIWNFWKEVDTEFTKKSLHSATLKQIQHTFNLIDSILQNLLDNGNENTLDYIFYPAALYVQSCRRLLPDHETLNQNVDALIPTLTRCKNIIASESGSRQHQQVITGDEYDEDIKMRLFSEEWWDVLLDPERASHPSRSTDSGRHRRNSGGAEVSTENRDWVSNPSRSSSLLDEVVGHSRAGTTRQLDQQGDPPPPDSGRRDMIAFDENRSAENLV